VNVSAETQVGTVRVKKILEDVDWVRIRYIVPEVNNMKTKNLFSRVDSRTLRPVNILDL